MVSGITFKIEVTMIKKIKDWVSKVIKPKERVYNDAEFKAMLASGKPIRHKRFELKSTPIIHGNIYGCYFKVPRGTAVSYKVKRCVMEYYDVQL